MTTRWSVGLRRVGLIAALALAASCDYKADVPTAPAHVEPQSGLLTQSTTSSYTLITEPLLGLPLSDLTISQVIGIDGGTISLLGHSLVVPAGAVSVPTLFTMVVLPSKEIDVELSATVTDLLGRVLNVGSSFAKPLTLSLSYARANNVTDPGKLFIVYFNGSKLDKLPSTVDLRAQTVATKLNHFSKYGMASD